MEKVLKNKVAILVFILPALMLFIGAAFIPTIWSFVYSLYSGIPGVSFKFVGATNYIKLINDKVFLASVMNNLKFILIVVSGQICLGLLAALMFQFIIKKNQVLVRTTVFFPVVLPTVAVAQLFVKIYEVAPQYGLINSILHLLNMDAYISAWHAETSTALISVCIPEIWRAIGFYAVIFYTALTSVSEELIEAAKIDGASGFALVRKIILPLIKPIIITATVFSLNGTLKVFELPYALTGGGPGSATQMVAMYMYKTAFTFSQYGYGSAIAIFLLLECLIITALVNRLTGSSNHYN